MTSRRVSVNGPEREPVEIRSDVPNAARVYNVLLGGDANFEADREATLQAVEVYPGGMEGARAAVRANRDFLGRAVRHLVDEEGVRQFLDLGTGIPDKTNVHAVAQRHAPESHVVCVDYDPVVLAHAHELMESTPEGTATFLNGDFRQPEPILRAAADTLDFTKPIAVMLIALLHLLDDNENPHQLVREYVDAVPSGSYLVMSHLTNDLIDMADSAARFTAAMTEPMVLRTQDEFRRFFAGLEFVEPGVVPIDQWHPDEPPRGDVVHYAAMARKP